MCTVDVLVSTSIILIVAFPYLTSAPLIHPNRNGSVRAKGGISHGDRGDFVFRMRFDGVIVLYLHNLRRPAVFHHFRISKNILTSSEMPSLCRRSVRLYCLLQELVVWLMLFTRRNKVSRRRGYLTSPHGRSSLLMNTSAMA